MYKLCVVALVALVFLAGCKGNDGFNVKYENSGISSTTPVVEEMPKTEESVSAEETNSEFPVAALAVRPNLKYERRENGNSGDNKIYYLNIVTEEKVSTCFNRRTEIKLTSSQNAAENWSIGQATKWDMSSTKVTVEIKEDTAMCPGGHSLIFKGSAMVDDSSFEIDQTTYSVRLYVDVQVHSLWTNDVKDVSIAIDATQVAEGEFAGGEINRNSNVKWEKGYNSEAGNLLEAVNVTFEGSVSVDNFAIQGISKSRLSRSISDYNNNGTPSADPFVIQRPVGVKG